MRCLIARGITNYHVGHNLPEMAPLWIPSVYNSTTFDYFIPQSKIAIC